jgi:hydrogenase expression/formation protein HypC
MCLALPATVMRTFEEAGVPMAEVDQGGIRRVVCLIYQPDAAVGDRLVIHSGFAIARAGPERGS